MKKIVNILYPTACAVAITLSVAAFNKAGAATTNPATTQTSPAPQPVDLTYAAEKSLPSVVHIKYVQNSKIRTVDVQSDPFSDFFNDPFGGFFGRGNGGTQKRASARVHRSLPAVPWQCAQCPFLPRMPPSSP